MAEHDLDELKRILEIHLGGGVIRDPFGISHLERKVKSGQQLSQEDLDKIKASLEWRLNPPVTEQFGLAAELRRDLERYYKERGIEPPKPESAGAVHVATIDPSRLVAASQADRVEAIPKAPRQSGKKKHKKRGGGPSTQKIEDRARWVYDWQLARLSEKRLGAERFAARTRGVFVSGSSLGRYAKDPEVITYIETHYSKEPEFKRVMHELRLSGAE